MCHKIQYNRGCNVLEYHSQMTTAFLRKFGYINVSRIQDNLSDLPPTGCELMNRGNNPYIGKHK